MPQTIVANAVRENDILTFPTNGDFQRRPHDSRMTYGIVREIVHDPAEPQTVKRFVVFEVVPSDTPILSGRRTVRLSNDHLDSYGLSKDRQPWLVIIDPVGVEINESRYFVSRTGHLDGGDINDIHNKILEMGGEDHVNMGGTGPQGIYGTDWNKIVTPGYERRIEDKEDPRQDKPPSAPKKPRRRRGLPNEGVTVDLPIDFAGQITDLDPRIIAALKAAGVSGMREARALADTPERLPASPTTMSGADDAPPLSLDDAINAGLIDGTLRGLTLVRDPVGGTPPMTSLNALFAAAQSGGAGFDAYTGLASKTGKIRVELMDAANTAWEKYQASQSADSGPEMAEKIKKAWSTVMSEYIQFVRPYINIEAGAMTEPDKIPARYKKDGKLVFTFPRIEMK